MFDGCEVLPGGDHDVFITVQGQHGFTDAGNVAFGGVVDHFPVPAALCLIEVAAEKHVTSPVVEVDGFKRGFILSGHPLVEGFPQGLFQGLIQWGGVYLVEQGVEDAHELCDPFRGHAGRGSQDGLVL